MIILSIYNKKNKYFLFSYCVDDFKITYPSVASNQNK